MDNVIKTKWIEALRSGEYQQITGQLADNMGGYCCLGVLCKVANIAIHSSGIDTILIDGEAGGYVPLDDMLGGIEITNALWLMNDSYKNTFAEIADHIEANL